jgi:hypothetical protein
VGVAATAFKRMRDQRTSVAPAAPEWPPFEPRIVPKPDIAAEPEPDAFVPSQSREPSAPLLTDVVWSAPDANGITPDGYPVKVKLSSGIFHVPGGRFYDRTTADRCYPSAAAAEADGYRPSKS